MADSVSSTEAAKIIDWVVNKLSNEDKENYSIAQITNAWTMGMYLHIDEAPNYEPSGFDEYTDYWDEVNLIIRDWIGVSVRGGRRENRDEL